MSPDSVDLSSLVKFKCTVNSFSFSEYLSLTYSFCGIVFPAAVSAI